MLFTVEHPETIINKLKEYFEEQNFEMNESEKRYKIKAKCLMNEDETTVNIKVEKIDENVNCIRVSRVDGNKMAFLDLYNELKVFLSEVEMIV